MPERQTNAERAAVKFKEAHEALQEFLNDVEIRPILQEFESLVNIRNQALDTAMRAIKSELRNMEQDKLVMEGLGAQKKYKRWYDTEFLARALPAEQADLVLSERVVYDLDQARLEQLARQGEIDNEIVRAAFHEEEQSPAALPGTPKPYEIPSLPVIDE